LKDVHGLGNTRPVYVTKICECVMSLKVSIREGETQDSLLRRFQKMVQMEGILREAKTHRYFLSKREAARLKAKRSSRRRRIGR
jgi:ribosomal protein S21